MPDNKFIDYYIEMSEDFIPDQSSYVFFKESSNFKFVKLKNKNIVSISKEKINTKHFISQLQNADAVIFHSLNSDYSNLIKAITKSTVLIWLFWGFDGYVTQKKGNYLGAVTSRFRYENSLKGYLRYLKNKYYNDKIVTKTGRIHMEMIRNIHYCATWVDKDFQLAKTINPYIKKMYFNYYTEELMRFPTPQIINSNLQTIMLGNSGSEYNNHAEALIFLNKIAFQGIIYCPLSYNGSIFYKQYIEAMGKGFFGNRFIPLKDFIPLDEYQNIINSCDVVWMNHKRQQAAGNLFAAFYAGKVVILDSDNPMISTFKKWGLTVHEKEVLINKKFEIKNLLYNQKVKELITIEKNNKFFKYLNNELIS